MRGENGGRVLISCFYNFFTFSSLDTGRRLQVVAFSMRRTVFDTPVVRQLLYLLAIFYLRVFRWKKEGRVPDVPKFVMIAAPHTSNWDLPLTLILSLAFRMKVFWMGKHTIFRPPFGGFFK